MSTDQSLSLALELGSIYANVHVIKRIENGGIVEARRTGLNLASQEWISFIDADDYIDSDAISIAHKVAKTQSADICIWDLWRADGNKIWKHLNLKANEFPKTGRQAVIETLGHWRIHPLGVAKKIKYLDAFEDFKFGSQNADELITRIFLSRVQKVSYCEARYFYRCNQKSSSQTISIGQLSTLNSHIWLLKFAKDYPEVPLEIIGSRSISQAWYFYRLRNRIGKVLTIKAISKFIPELVENGKPYKWLWKYPKNFIAFIYLYIATKNF
jgi:glycosyltransferase involved in cell wall biosynthesis